ncbi:MAG TPA: Mur ligase family protein [Candidatus Saccharimonadales bacterium]|nr:Mur ligase family protein [Candidatus Saccharimonadales bacterium]
MKLLSYFSIKTPLYLAYMAQQVEYEPDKLVGWLLRRPNLFKVMRRKELVMTKKASALILFQYICLALFLVFLGVLSSMISSILFIAVLLVPIVSAGSLMLAIYGGRALTWPINKRKVEKSKTIFSKHPGTKIAILGSYGKTTMKELLYTVLSEAKNVKATPGNKNVPISHARWAESLSGDEDILLIEYGEAKPGDIPAFCENTSPDYAVVTGIAPNHMDRYKTLENLANDIASVSRFVNLEKIYLNADEDKLTRSTELSKANLYGSAGVGKAKIKDVKIGLEGMSFSVQTGKESIALKTGLVGRHLLGPLAVCVLLALKFGLSKEEIKHAISRTKPFEHRLQPKEINGAWIIDDTYNGSLEGFRAGLALLKELKAKRKVYVTPGLVDQGEETERVHREIGKLIAECNPDKVVLMNNSTTEYIKSSLKSHGYKGQFEVQDEPLEYYMNLEHTLAAGDIVLLQNDWTDNYS